MSAQVLKTEQLLSQISTQTRAAYTSLCALCVRSRLEVYEHKRVSITRTLARSAPRSFSSVRALSYDAPFASN